MGQGKKKDHGVRQGSTFPKRPRWPFFLIFFPPVRCFWYESQVIIFVIMVQRDTLLILIKPKAHIQCMPYICTLCILNIFKRKRGKSTECIEL